MKPKFTPGKWSAQYFTDSTTLIKAENHTKAIAEVRGTNIKANAALIAASPEMFEALELLINDNRLMNAMNKEQAKAIMYSLAKARGE